MMLALDGAWNRFNAKMYPSSCGPKYSRPALDIFRGGNHMVKMVPHIQLYEKFNKFSRYDAGPGWCLEQV